jgi:DNA-binding NarL/FixJ family response regulator
MSKILPGTGETQSRYEINANQLPEWFYLLTRKERQILRLVIEGFTNQEIAERVFFATQTVKNYLSTIYEKLDVHTRLEAIKITHKYLNYL